MKSSFLNGKVLGLLLVLILAGCTPAAAPTLSIEGAWGKPSMDFPTAGGLYMVIKNTGSAPDKLVSGKSPACGAIEVHEMVKKTDGTMGMNLVDKPVEIAANGQIELKSGSLHIMCIMKKDEQFKPGSKIDVTLVFEKSGEKTFGAEIRAQ